MRRVVPFALSVAAAAALFSADVEAVRHSPSGQSATCESSRIKPDSYRLVTEAQALNVLRPREPWWEPFGVWKTQREIGDLNEGATALAERARELDDTNLLAHGQLARQYLVMAIDARKAEDAWTRVLDNGGAVAWTATLYEIDPRSLFVIAFDRKSMRIYRFRQLAGEVDEHFGVPEFPGPEQADFWRALGGCLPSNIAPAAEISWSDVEEIEATNWTLRFELAQKVSLTSDRGSRRNDESLEITLHVQPGAVDYRFAMTPYRPRPFFFRRAGPDPLLFQERVRHTLVKFVDPAGRIALPKPHRSWGG